MTTLIGEIDTKLDALSNIDKRWVVFVVDHKDTIRENSNLVVVSDSDRDRYRFKFNHYLRDNGCEQNIHWIAKLINDLEQFTDFTIKDNVYVPNRAFIMTMYRLYRTSMAS